MNNSEYNNWIKNHNTSGMTKLELKEEFLKEWLNNNYKHYYSVEELAEKLFEIMISLDMDQYVSSKYDNKKLILYSGKSSDEVNYFEVLEGSPRLEEKYVLANRTEMAHFVLFELDNWSQSKYGLNSINQNNFINECSALFVNVPSSRTPKDVCLLSLMTHFLEVCGCKMNYLLF